MSIKCSECLFDNPDDTKFCGECGTRFDSSPDAPAIPTITMETPKEELTTGTTFAGRYQIIEELGKGGMGKVYKAFDKKIDEKIAIKLINPLIAADKKTVERFSNELKYARRIRHKNVCQMFDLGEANNILYITMEYVHGEDLKRLIRKVGNLSPAQTIAIAKQICSGLVEAHKLGIIHRDLKPQNIIVDEEGNARIMDFGIARSLKTKGITGAGAMIGTPEYMPPEQVESKDIDQRSDIYSFGVMLFEMVTGQLPFSGDTPFSVGIKQKTEMPPDPKVINPNIPGDLGRLILKCLEKDKEDRFQSAGEVRSALEQITVGLPTSEQTVAPRKPITSKEITVTLGVKKLIPVVAVIALALIVLVLWQVLSREETISAPMIENSLAVISFENQTGDKSYDYLQKAIPSLLITSLENTGRFYVATWERMYDLLKQMGKGEVQNIDRKLGFDLCRREGIKAIVIGSFIKMGDTFATDVKVLDVASKKLLKSASSQGTGIDSILKSQINTLSVEILRAVKIPKDKTDPSTVRIDEVTTESMEAYQWFLKGKEAHERFHNAIAVEHLSRAIVLDPKFAAAYLYLGHARMQIAERSEALESFRKAKSLAARATEKERLFIDAEYYSWFEREPGKKMQILQELVKKYPKEKQVYHELGSIYGSRDMYTEAIEQYLKALELDPDWGYVLNAIAYVYSDAGDYEKAIEYFQKYISVSPGEPNPIDSLAEQYFRMGRLDEALLKYKEALNIIPGFDSSLRMALIYAVKEDYALTEEWLDRFIADRDSPGQKAEGYLWQGIFAFLQGKRELAFASLLKAENLADQVRAATIDCTRGWIYYELGQFDLSLEYMNKMWVVILKYFPDSIRFQSASEVDLGIVEVRQNKMEEARGRLGRIKSLQEKANTPLTKNSTKYYFDWLSAEILLAEGAPEQAVEILENIPTKQVPNLQTDIYGPYNFPYRQDFLARAYLQAGRIDDAIAEYERKIVFDPEDKDYHLIHPIYHYLLAKLYKGKGLNTKAIEQYQQYLAIMIDADAGIAEVEDAKKRLAELKK